MSGLNDVNIEILLELISKAEANIDKVYELLESLCICFPGRISGSESLDKALSFLYEYGCDNIPDSETNCYTEDVPDVPRWIRGSLALDILNKLFISIS